MWLLTIERHRGCGFLGRLVCFLSTLAPGVCIHAWGDPCVLAPAC